MQECDDEGNKARLVCSSESGVENVASKDHLNGIILRKKKQKNEVVSGRIYEVERGSLKVESWLINW